MYSVYDSETAEIVQTSCLGAQRELGGETISISPLGMTTYYSTYTYNMFTSNASYPAPKPTCTFDVTACNSLWDMHDDYMDSVATIWPSNEYTSISPVYYPVCEPQRPGKYCDTCTIGAHMVQMYYWPPIAIGEPCDPNRRFTTATPTLPGYPNTIAFGTTTFTSPTVYLSFYRLGAQQSKAFGQYNCGKEFTDIIVQIQPESVSSIRWTRTDYPSYTHTFTFGYDNDTTLSEMIASNFTLSAGQPRSVSYGDFIGAVPVDAYMGQMWQAMPDATTEIIDMQYSPHLAVPSQLRTLDPLWKNCGVYLEGVWDPPLPLMAASSIAQPSMPTFMTTTSRAPVAPSSLPAPGNLPTTPYISATTTPQAQTLPTKDAGATAIAYPDDPVSQPSAGGSFSGPPENSVNPGTRIMSILNDLNSAANAATLRTMTIGGIQATASQIGSILVIEGHSMTLGGTAATIRGQEISLATNGLQIASSTTMRFGPSSTPTGQKVAVWEDTNMHVSVVQMESEIVLSDGSAVTIVAFGQSTLFNGHTFTASADGNSFQVDGSEDIALRSPAAAKARPYHDVISEGGGEYLVDPVSQMDLTIGGKPHTAIRDHSSFLLISGPSVITIAHGDRASVEGAMVEVLADGSGLILKVTSVVPLHESDDHADATDISAVVNGRYIIVQLGETKVTLRGGAATTLGSNAVSADRNGRYVVLNASVTRTVASSTIPGHESIDSDISDPMATGAASRCSAFFWGLPILSTAALLIW